MYELEEKKRVQLASCSSMSAIVAIWRLLKQQQLLLVVVICTTVPGGFKL
jgi:hypothetical protein